MCLHKQQQWQRRKTKNTMQNGITIWFCMSNKAFKTIIWGENFLKLSKYKFILRFLLQDSNKVTKWGHIVSPQCLEDALLTLSYHSPLLAASLIREGAVEALMTQLSRSHRDPRGGLKSAIALRSMAKHEKLSLVINKNFSKPLLNSLLSNNSMESIDQFDGKHLRHHISCLARICKL